MEADAKRRLAWVRMHLETRDAGLTCRRCGISRPTLRKWVQRFQTNGEEGLTSRSTRPSRSPAQRIDKTVREAILELRRSKNIGARRIQIELGFTRDLWLSRTIIQRTLDCAGVKPLKRPRRPEKPKRYNRPVPGDRVQMDTMRSHAAYISTPPWTTATAFVCSVCILAGRGSTPLPSLNV